MARCFSISSLSLLSASLENEHQASYLPDSESDGKNETHTPGDWNIFGKVNHKYKTEDSNTS